MLGTIRVRARSNAPIDGEGTMSRGWRPEDTPLKVGVCLLSAALVLVLIAELMIVLEPARLGVRTWRPVRFGS